MPHPDLIRIVNEPESPTEFVGRYAHGLFFGDLIADLEWASPDARFTLSGFVHFFDFDGTYVRTEFKPFVEDEEEVRAWLSETVDGLEQREFDDIDLRLFRFEAYGREWGLVDRGPDSDWVDLEPQDFGFTEPWDGSYDT